MTLERLEVIGQHVKKPEPRRAEIPGLGVDSAPQIIAEVGPEAASFPSSGQMDSLSVR